MVQTQNADSEVISAVNHTQTGSVSTQTSDSKEVDKKVINDGYDEDKRSLIFF